MLLTSKFTVTLLSALVVLSLHKLFSAVQHRLVSAFLQMVTLFSVMVVIKMMIPRSADDAHIWNLLRSKFTDYKDFHILLYTCAVEFDFIEYETIVKLITTLLLPISSMLVFVIIYEVLFSDGKHPHKGNTVNCELSSPYIVYNVVQLGIFSVMATLIMRLKLFFTPHLCLMCSLVFNTHISYYFKSRAVYFGVVVGAISVMSYTGIHNLQQQWSILGEYSNPELEELLHWVDTSTPPTAVFAGSMPTMANLMLSTRRPIVNHPHYEDASLRERTKLVYNMFSRKPIDEVHGQLKDLGVQFAVVEETWCFGRRREGCSMVEIWDVEDPVNKNRPMVCEKFYSNSFPFKVVFKNSVYVVLRVDTG